MNVAVEMAVLKADFVLRRVDVKRKGDSKLMKAIAKGLSVVTFGRAGGKDFLNDYITTIGRTIYVPDGFDGWPEEAKLAVLTHESHHVFQYERYGVLMMLAYFLPLPMFLAYGRYCIERAAYVEGWKVEMALIPGLRPLLIDEGVDEMTGPKYGWAWPFPKSVRTWFEKNLPKS